MKFKGLVKSGFVKESFTYHLAIWVLVLGFFITLDFTKEVDELFNGSTPVELLANLFAPALLIWLVSSIIAFFSALLEAKGWIRLVNFIVIFAFVTINLWSLRSASLKAYLMLQPPRRLQVGIGVLIVVLLLVAMIVKKSAERLSWLQHNKGLVLKLLIAVTAAFACAVALSRYVSLVPPSRPSTRTPNIIMVTFDALSAENLELYGYPQRTAPNIERLAKESIVFDNFRTNYTYTPPALTAIQGNPAERVGPYAWSKEPGLFEVLSKTYPNQGFFGYYCAYDYFHRRLPAEGITRIGQKTLMYKCFDYLLPTDSLLYLGNLLSGELRTYWPYNGEYDDDNFWRKNHFPEDLSFKAALDYLEQNPKGSFVWVHTWAPHYPYWPDKDVANEFGLWSMTPADFMNVAFYPTQSPWVDQLRKRYDASIYSVDRNFGKFLDELKQRGLYDDSILIVGSDHGESHSNGFVGHSGPSVVEEITHIPMMIHLPGQKVQTRVSTLASQLDLAPTVLELAGVASSNQFPGRSLMPFIDNPEVKDSRVHFTVSYSAFLGEGGDIALYKDNYKVVYYSFGKSRIRLYDLKTDPKAVVNIIAQHKDIAEDIMKEAGVW